jgi:hypothetical protein
MLPNALLFGPAGELPYRATTCSSNYRTVRILSAILQQSESRRFQTTAAHRKVVTNTFV